MKNSWKKTSFAMLSILFLGLLLCVVSAFMVKNNVWFTAIVSIGCSLLATAISSYLMDKTQDTTIDELKQLIMEQDNKIKKIGKDTNDRIFCGRHLRQVVTDALKQYSSGPETLEIDVMGMELINFWTEQRERLLACPNFKLRMLVQDPHSEIFELMAINEQVSYSTTKSNIEKVTKDVISYSVGLSKKQRIELRWLYFPASATLIRINDTVYVRTRLIDSSHVDDDHFFEKYEVGDIPFYSFKHYFSNAWKHCWNDSNFGKLGLAKNHYDSYTRSFLVLRGTDE